MAGIHLHNTAVEGMPGHQFGFLCDKLGLTVWRSRALLSLLNTGDLANAFSKA